MNNIFKRILLLWFVFFTQFIYADKDTTYIHISNVSANEATGKMTFTVTIDALPLSITSPVRVGFETIDGTAKVDDNDYTAKDSADISTLAVWFFSNSASTSKTIEIDILDDAIYESSEYFYLKITTNTNGYAISGTGIATGTIIDDDVQPLELNTFNDKGITETDSNQTIYMVANFNQNTPTPLTLTYHTQDNSALAGDDYIGITDTITVPANVDRVLIPVTIKGDYTPESTKDFKVIIDSISIGTITDDTATISIHDDDAIEISIDSSNVNEGDANDSNKMRFTISLAKNYPLTTPLTIDYTTQEGTATAGSDYTAKSGSVTFNQGDKNKFVDVDIIGDNEIEYNEYLEMIISGSSYIVNDNTRSYILNDDGSFPSISFDNNSSFSVVEGNSSQRNLNFTFTLDSPAVTGSQFKYETIDNSATVDDNDYSNTHGTKNIPAGDTNVTISVPVYGDTKIENNENFYLEIYNFDKLNLSGASKVTGTIINDDGSYPTISIKDNNYSITEGDSGQKDINFTLILNKPTIYPASFDYYTYGQTATTSDNDYIEIGETYHISVGEQNITIPVKVNGDTKIEDDEKFHFVFTNEKNLTKAGAKYAFGTIINDDGNLSEFSIDAPILTFDEKDSNQTRVDFTIRLDTPAKEDNLSIEYLTSNGSAEQEDLDYNQIVPTVATFNTGEQSKVFSAYINGDTNIEPDESFFIKLQNPKNATLASAPNNQIEITITNDDAHNELPFTCDESMYISSSIKRGSGSKGKMWLHKIDTTQNPFGFNVVDDSGETKLYNALAYSDSGDANSTNYIFGLYKKELVKISRTGKVISLGKVAGLPKILTKKQLFAGAIYNGEYYISGPGQDYDKIFKIKLSDKTVTELTLDTAISLLDFSFTPDGKYLHGIVDGGKMVKIDVNTGAVTFIGSAHTGYQFDSTFSDANGRFFANDSLGNGFFEFDLTTGNKRFLSDSQPATFNDGANCLKASLVFTDYGDAPISYGPVWHNIANGIFLGDNIDHDLD
ncbi:MAG TPA: hypothetical protein ENK66_02005, partial [Arcobacter sp.]|nr:hypothetical protein [Arcobacter sp.]